jgi:uncharacterized coiled-coil DUF342 family protein
MGWWPEETCAQCGRGVQAPQGVSGTTSAGWDRGQVQPADARATEADLRSQADGHSAMVADRDDDAVWMVDELTERVAELRRLLDEARQANTEMVEQNTRLYTERQELVGQLHRERDSHFETRRELAHRLDEEREDHSDTRSELTIARQDAIDLFQENKKLRAKLDAIRITVQG